MRRTWSSLSFVLLAAAGCGEIKSHADANNGDDDAPAIDASTVGDITVVTHSRTAPGVVGTIDIVAINPDGEVVTALTNGSGEATLAIKAGASVTAIYRELDGGVLFTYTGVEPGDQLVFGRDVPPAPSIIGSMTASFPSAGASSYDVYHACGESSGSVELLTASMTQTSNCQVANQDVLFYAYNGSGVLQNWGRVQDAPWINNGTVTLPSWQAPTSFTGTINNLPAEVVGAGLEMHVIAQLPTVQSFFVFESGAPAAGTFTFSAPWGSGGDGIIGLMIAQSDSSAQFQSRRLAATSTQHVVSEPIGVPWMGAVSLDVAAREITFQLDGDQPHDTVSLALEYSRVAPDSGVEEFIWQFVVPPGHDGSNTLELPDLPAAFARFLPAATDTVDAFGTVYDFESANSYAEVRARPEWQLGSGTETFIQALLFEESHFSQSGGLRAARMAGDELQPFTFADLRSRR